MNWIEDNWRIAVIITVIVGLLALFVVAELSRLDFVKDCLVLGGQFIKVDGAWVCAKLDVLKTYR